MTPKQITQWIRELFCQHRCRVQDLHWIQEGVVACKCLRCGKTLTGPYGLALNCHLIDDPTPPLP
jgi:hypothetical protein